MILSPLGLHFAVNRADFTMHLGYISIIYILTDAICKKLNETNIRPIRNLIVANYKYLLIGYTCIMQIALPCGLYA